MPHAGPRLNVDDNREVYTDTDTGGSIVGHTASCSRCKVHVLIASPTLLSILVNSQ